VTFAKQVAVVTGASSGIGAELARQLAAAGARVGMLDLPDTGLQSRAHAIRSQGRSALAIEADLTEPDAVRSALERFVRELGNIDLLILNAGIGMITKVESFSAEAIDKMMAVNVLGVAYPIEFVLPSMLRRRSGHLVGISSLSAYRGQPIFSGYCASKAAVASLLEGLRIELRPYGIAVTTVRPGFVRTPLTASFKAPRFVQEVEPAARVILRGIAARRAQVNFPWQAALVMGLTRWLPVGLYDRIAGSVIERARQSLAQ
jgi:NAD(P)-dependent dehydrogenase (short-subunit alcohol dehydrogenase family)